MSRVYFCLARRLLMTTPLRIALFIDAQNAYRRARDRFFPNPQSNVDGQFDPIKLGQLIASRGGPGGLPCSLSDVRIYSGRPDPNRDKRSHAAHMRQSNRWRANGATVIMQGLRYPPTWPTDPAQEKGIDVALAIDFVRLAITGAYDVGVMMSTDTDLLPALRFVYDHDLGLFTLQWQPGVSLRIAGDYGCPAPAFGATGWTRRITTPWRIGTGINAGRRSAFRYYT